MGFGSNSTSSVDFKLQEAEQKRQLKADLSTLGAAIEEAQAILDGFTVTKEDLGKAKTALADLNDQIKEKTMAKGVLEAAQAELATLKTAITAAQGDISVYEAELRELVADRNQAAADLVLAQRDLEDLQKQTASAEQRQAGVQDALTAATNQANKEMERLNTGISELNTQKTAFALDVRDLTIAISDLTTEATRLEIQNAAGKTAITSLLAEHSKKEADLRTKYQALEEQLAEDLKQPRLDLAEREGRISERESWNAEKEKRLNNIKNQLEKEFGRKINITI